MFNWKNIFKSWASIPVLILAALVIVWFFVTVAPRITVAFKSWQAQRAYDKILEPYYKDIYGGKTPEETYDLLIGALKANNIELAVKYFGSDNQETWGKTLTEYKNTNSLKQFISELESHIKTWNLKENDGDRATYLYPYTREIPRITELPIAGGKIQKITLPAGNFDAETKFYRNIYTNIWKIELP